MHSAFFNMKRVYYRSFAVARRELKEHKITPARFDILYTLYNSRARECARADLVAVIGTVKSNIWRLCDAIEAQGLAKRDWDGLVIIKLTDEGVELVERVLATCSDNIEEVVDQCAAPPDPAEDDVERLGNTLRKVRSGLDDKHLFDPYAPQFRERVWALRIVPRHERIMARAQRAIDRASRGASPRARYA